MRNPILLSFTFIYFDLDDTLLDHKSAEQAALGDLHSHFDLFSGIELSHLIATYHDINSELWHRYGNNMMDKVTLQRLRFENTLKALGLDDSAYDEVGSYYLECYANHWQWNDGAEKALKKISDRFNVGILTNGFSEIQKRKINRFELRRFAKHLVISEDVGYLKPQPEIFEYATSLAEQSAQDILYVGDSYNSDIEGGSAFGWNTAWYIDSEEIEEKKLSKPDFTFKNFSDLCVFLDI